MQTYFHERSTNKSTVDNTTWPLMSIDGVDMDDCNQYMSDRGLSWALAEASGWYPSRKAGDNFLRIVIPALTTKQGHVYWQARAISKNVYIRYQSPKGPRHGALVRVRAFPEGEPTLEVVIVEGPMDALAVAECGYDSVALMGMSPGPDALVHLAKLVDLRPALIVLDNEQAAQSNASEIAMRLASRGSAAHVEKLRYVKDIAAMKHKDRQSWLDDTISPGWRYDEKA